MSNQILIEALKEILSSAEEHPCYSRYSKKQSWIDEINDEGGDTAFVTLDIAFVARNALESVKHV